MTKIKFIGISFLVIGCLLLGFYGATISVSSVSIKKPEQKINTTLPVKIIAEKNTNNNLKTATSEEQKTAKYTTLDGTPIGIIHAQLVPEVDSAAGLLKISSNVFIGKILKKIGSEFVYYSKIPSTRYEVEVKGNLKGNIVGKISLLQNRVGYGTGKYGYQLFVDEGDVVNSLSSNKINADDIFLKQGGLYLFITGYDQKKDLYGISAPPYDRELITTDAALTDAQVLSAAENNPRVREFMNAAGIKTLQSAHQ